MKKLPWFQFRDHLRGRPHWRVYFVDEMPAPNATALGLCDYEERALYIRALAPKRQFKAILAHELFHAALAHRRTTDDADNAQEERFANEIEPSLLAIVASLGAQLPPFPDELTAFRKAARARA